MPWRTGPQPRCVPRPRPLYFVFVNHGDPGAFHIYTGGESADDLMTPGDLDAWFDALSVNLGDDTAGQLAKSQPVVIVNGSCFSGSFCSSLAQDPGELPQRIVIASAASDESSIKGPPDPGSNVRDGELFVTSFFHALGLGYDMKSSYDKAAGKVSIYSASRYGAGKGDQYDDGGIQHAQLDDNGDGHTTHELLYEPPRSEDGWQARRMGLGFDKDVSPTQLDFLAVSRSITLTPGGTEAPALSATLDDPVGELPEVWVLVKSPGFQVSTSGDSEQVAVDLFMSDPVYPDAASKSMTEYAWSPARMSDHDFSTPGAYEAVYFAVNPVGDAAPLMRTYIYRPPTGYTGAPDSFGLLFPEAGAVVSERAVFAWQHAGLAGGSEVTYSLELTPMNAAVPVIRIDGLPSPHYVFPPPARGGYRASDLRDGVIYEWTVTAYDQYGGDTVASEIRHVEIDEFANLGVDTGMALIKVVDDETGAPVEDAVVTIGLTALSTPIYYQGRGEYLCTEIPEGSYPVGRLRAGGHHARPARLWQPLRLERPGGVVPDPNKDRAASPPCAQFGAPGGGSRDGR